MKMKKNMKHLIAAVLSLVMVFSLAACGGTENTDGAEGSENPIAVISREDGSGTRSAFVELMGIMVDDVDNTTVQAEISQSTSVVMTTVAGNPNAIGYVSMGSLSDQVKAIKVDGAEATTDNVKAGNYPVSRPFVVATNDKVSALAEDFIEYIMSAEGQNIIAAEGYITIADDAQPYVEKEGIEGKLVLAGSTSVAPVMEVIAENYKALYANVEIEIQQTGSGAGITSTQENACDIGMSSRALKEEELASGLTETTIAMDGIAVVVNPENTVEDLTSEQIRQIFTGEITDWNAVQ